MYQYFTACDLNYSWWAIHLASSMYANSPKSNFTVFLVTVAEESLEKKKDIEKVFRDAHPDISILWCNTPEIEQKDIPRYCAGFRTHIFGPDRLEYFDKEDTLVWIDADSLVRKDLKFLELFCNENNFDTSARPKNTKDKFASGLIVQKPTPAGTLFGKDWHYKWKERFYNKEWTADQNSFNDTVSKNHESNASKTIGLPREFCDVWLSDNGVIWQAKHQTKMKKKYVCEMEKYRPDINNSLFWSSLLENSIKVSIDSTSFIFDDVSFEFMGLDGEKTFDAIKDNGSFINLEFLEMLRSLGNTDGLIDIGAGLQNNTVHLSYFTDPIISISIEPHIKMIDMGLRNAQNNPGIEKNTLILGTHTNFWTSIISPEGKSVKIDLSSVGDIDETSLQRDMEGVPQILSIPEDLDFACLNYLKNNKYKDMSLLKYDFETWESYEKKEEYIKNGSFNLSEFQNAKMQTLDFLCKALHVSLPGVPQLVQKKYNWDQCVGMIIVDVFDSSLEILRSGKNAINFFKPHIGVVVYNKRDRDERIARIENLLGSSYNNIYRGPNQLMPDATCLVYQSLGRKHE